MTRKAKTLQFSLGIVNSLSALYGCYRVSGGQQEILITFGEICSYFPRTHPETFYIYKGNIQN